MSELESKVRRFEENEQRVDEFVNGGPTTTWESSGGVSIPSIRKFFADTETSYGDARSAADVAVLAKDSAVAATGPWYSTEAEGRAAVADGETFKVQGSGFVAARFYRRLTGTTSSLLAELPAAAIDSLTVNSGKAYPLLQKTKGGITSDINTGFAAFILDIAVIGGNPEKLYQILQFTNGESGLADRWQIAEYTPAEFSSGAAGTVIKFVADTAPSVDRTQSVQKIALDTRVDGLVFVMTIAPNALPAFGTRLNIQSTTHNGYSWVVHPQCLMPDSMRSAIVKNLQDQLAQTNSVVAANSAKFEGMYQSPENRMNRLQRAIKDPFESVRIRLIGDSITWGRTASNNSPTDPRTGYLSDPRNTTSVYSPTWANLLLNWLAHSYGEGVVTEYGPGNAGFITPSDCCLLSGNKELVKWLKGGNPVSPGSLPIVTSGSSKTGRYLDMSTALGVPDAVEFTTTAESLDIYYAALSDRPQADRKVDVWVDGVVADSFYAYAPVSAWNAKHTCVLDGKRHTVRIGLSTGAAQVRFIGITANRMIRVANDGIIGSSFSSWVARNLLADSIAPTDTHVLVQLGTNDRVQSGSSVDKFTEDLKTFMNQLKVLAPTADVTLLVANAVLQDENEISTFKFKMRDVDNVLRRVAADSNSGFISQYTHTMQAKIDGIEFVPDMLHPNDYGHKLMFENIRDTLLK